MTLPAFLGIGAMKAGTSAVHELLAQHPDIALPRHRKEVMFFDRYYDRGRDWYADHFSHAGSRTPGEVTPGYLFCPEAAARIAAQVPEARLFVLLRDPVDRAYSQYKFHVKESGQRQQVAEFLREHPNAIARGRYHEQLSRYWAHFNREQLLVVFFEDFKSDPTGVMTQIFQHIGVDAAHVLSDAGRARNTSTTPRFHRSYALGRRLLAWLYAHDMAWVVHGLKRTGLKRLFIRQGTDPSAFAPMTEDDRQTILAAVSDDLVALQRALGRPLPPSWHTT